MPELPVLSGAELVRTLSKLGFLPVRKRGSHVILKRVTSYGTSGCAIPMHKELKPGTLRGILRQAGVSLRELLEVLK